MKKKFLLSILFVSVVIGLTLTSTTYAKATLQKVKTAIAPVSKQIKPQVANSVILNGDGTVRIFGTKVTKTDGVSIYTESEINGRFVAFVINTDSETKILTASSDNSVNGIPIDSIIMVTGIFENFNQGLTVLANEIRVRSETGELLAKPIVEVVGTSTEATSTAETSASTSTSTPTSTATTTKISDTGTSTAVTEDSSSTTEEVVFPDSSSTTEATTTSVIGGIVDSLAGAVVDAITNAIDNAKDVTGLGTTTEEVVPAPAPAPEVVVEVPAKTDEAVSETVPAPAEN